MRKACKRTFFAGACAFADSGYSILQKHAYCAGAGAAGVGSDGALGAAGILMVVLVLLGPADGTPLLAKNQIPTPTIATRTSAKTAAAPPPPSPFTTVVILNLLINSGVQADPLCCSKVPPE